jgi:hypothetical protein
MEDIFRTADLSPDGKYRYLLTRRWSRFAGGGRRIMWVMLNPSIADATKDDPTIRRCIKFSQRWGFDEMMVCNVYAYRATKPEDLPDDYAERAGPKNDEYLRHISSLAATIVCAWGTKGLKVAPWAIAYGKRLWCLGKTKHGYPKHPLYLPADTQLEAF